MKKHIPRKWPLNLCLWIILPIIGAVSAWASADCTKPQAIKRGTYLIVSAMPDKWCLELLPDNRTLQFNSCSHSTPPKRSQQFTFGAEEPGNGNGCFGMKAEGDTLETAWVQDTTAALSDPDLLEVSPNNGSNIYWLVEKHPDGTLRFVSAHVPPAKRWCIDRRNPDDDRHAQLLDCRETPEQEFTVQAVPSNALHQKKRSD